MRWNKWQIPCFTELIRERENSSLNFLFYISKCDYNYNIVSIRIWKLKCVFRIMGKICHRRKVSLHDILKYRVPLGFTGGPWGAWNWVMRSTSAGREGTLRTGPAAARFPEVSGCPSPASSTGSRTSRSRERVQRWDSVVPSSRGRVWVEWWPLLVLTQVCLSEAAENTDSSWYPGSPPTPLEEPNVHGAKGCPAVSIHNGGRWGRNGGSRGCEGPVLQVKLCSEQEQRQLPLTPQDFCSSNLGSNPALNTAVTATAPVYLPWSTSPMSKYYSLEKRMEVLKNRNK